MSSGADILNHSGGASALAVFRRRWRTLAITVVVVLGVSVVVDEIETPMYKATAIVYLNPISLANQVEGAALPATDSLSLARAAQTQAVIAASPQVAAAAVSLARVRGLSSREVSAETSIAPESNADLLNFGVVDANPERAMKVATAYALAYISSAIKLDTGPIGLATARLRGQIAQLGAGGRSNPSLYANLEERLQQLQSLSDLETSNASLVQRPVSAPKVKPRRSLNAVLSLLLGLVFGAVLMWVREQFDARLKDDAEIGEIVQSPQLGRLSRPTRRGASAQRLITLSEPDGANAEEFRQLRLNFELASLTAGGGRSFVFSSAFAAEGKSTTVANLAVSLSRVGKSVLVVDIDLRRPTQAGMFAVFAGAGLTDVIRGGATLGDALVDVTPSDQDLHSSTPTDSSRGVIKLLPAGPLPPRAGDFLALPRVSEFIRSLAGAGDFDYVLVDSPPIAPFADALSIATAVDGLVLTARRDVVTRSALRSTMAAIANAKLLCVGYIVTDAKVAREAYGYYAPSAKELGSATFDEVELTRAAEAPSR